ncbi:MAG: DUF1294 domain-containing protein [Thermoplasmatota archaeon]
MDATDLFLGWIALVTVVTFVAMGIDKSRARDGKRRIRERTLLTGAALGGSFGMLLGMAVFRHKTRKLSFILPFVLIVVAQGIVAWLVARALALA